MNCKPGDIAILVRASVPTNIGALCEVLGPSRFPEYDWLIRFQSERPLRFSDACCHDSWLRPITPPPGSVTSEEVRKLYSGRELVNIVKERL